MKLLKTVPFFSLLLALLFAGGCNKDDDASPNGGTDTTKPTVTLADPLNSATNVAVNKSIAITFSEALDATTINASTFTLKQGTTSIAGTVSYAGNTATFKPSANLAFNNIYTFTITTGAKDVAGNALAANFAGSFTTTTAPDAIAPTIVSNDPLNDATDVSRNKVVSILFSETMDASTISSSTFTVKQGTTAVAGVVAYSGMTATFTSTDFFAINTIYTATVSTGAKDAAGNVLASGKTWNFTTIGSAATRAVVDLGSAIDYVILAKTAINNSSTSTITGDLGLSPAATSYITGLALTNAIGYATSSQVTGKLYAADMAVPTPTNLTTSVNNMITAYNDAAGRTLPDFVELGAGNVGGKTLTAGLYKWTSNVIVPTSITISGSATDVWILQIAGNLTMSSAVNITLSGGAQAKNIFWQVAGQVTLGTTSHFEGIILSQTGITLQTGASINGQALAQTAVILDSNVVVKK